MGVEAAGAARFPNPLIDGKWYVAMFDQAEHRFGLLLEGPFDTVHHAAIRLLNNAAGGAERRHADSTVELVPVQLHIPLSTGVSDGEAECVQLYLRRRPRLNLVGDYFREDGRFFGSGF